MMKRKTLLLTALGLSLVAIGAIGGATYAAYRSSVSIGNNIASDGFRKVSLFLDVSKVLSGGNTWEADDAFFYVDAYVGSSSVTKTRYASIGTNSSGYYVFQIPMATYTHIIFVRAHIVGGTITDWNPSSRMSLYATEREAATKDNYDYNHWKVTDWYVVELQPNVTP